MITKEWSKFNHAEGYEKRMQDVKLKNGDILYCCWPNAGVWNVCNKAQNPKYYGKPEISVNETDEVRLTHDKLNEGV
jgi:hypothetical protein